MADIDQIVQKLKKFECNCEEKRIIDISDKGNRPIATLFIDDKYIQFHDEYTQIGIEVPPLKELLEAGDWDHNHT